jgi:hypothetical protein
MLLVKKKKKKKKKKKLYDWAILRFLKINTKTAEISLIVQTRRCANAKLETLKGFTPFPIRKGIHESTKVQKLQNYIFLV